jgi:hypothetical protein
MINFWIELQLMMIATLMVAHFVAIVNKRSKRS